MVSWIRKITNKKIEVYDVEEEQIGKDGDISSIVKSLDRGDGADFNEIIKKINKPEAEKLLNNLIKIGELFEIRPGKIKILE